MNNINSNNNPESQINEDNTRDSVSNSNHTRQPYSVNVESIFNNDDDDGGYSNYTVTLADDTDLPDYITFDSFSNTISIIESEDMPENLTLKVTKSNGDIEFSRLLSMYGIFSQSDTFTQEETELPQLRLLSELFNQTDMNEVGDIQRYFYDNNDNSFQSISHFLRLYHLAKPEFKHLFSETYAEGEYTFAIAGYPNYTVEVTDLETIKILRADLNTLALESLSTISVLKRHNYILMHPIERAKLDLNECKKAPDKLLSLFMLMEKRLIDSSIGSQQNNPLTSNQINSDENAFEILFTQGGMLYLLLECEFTKAISYFINSELLFKSYDMSKQFEFSKYNDFKEVSQDKLSELILLQIDVNYIKTLENKGVIITNDGLIGATKKEFIQINTIKNILYLLHHKDITFINNHQKEIIQFLVEKKDISFSSILRIAGVEVRNEKSILEFYFVNEDTPQENNKKYSSEVISWILHVYSNFNYLNLQPHIHKLFKYVFSNNFATTGYHLLTPIDITNLLNLMHKYINNSEYRDQAFITGKYNSAFNLLIFTAINSNDKTLIDNAKLLYEKYLKLLPKVKSIIDQPDFKFTFGNMEGESEVDWDDANYRDLNNYVFIHYDLIMLLSTNWLDKFFKVDQETFNLIDWKQICLFNKKFENINLAECQYKLPKIFTKCFPIFGRHFTACYGFGNIIDLIKSLSLEKYEKLFVEAILTATSKTKLVDDYADDLKLNAILTKNINITADNKRDGITNKHLDEIKKIFDLKQKSNFEVAQYLVCIAFIFIKASSSSIFGSEYESINSLRLYAYALLQQAYKLNQHSIFLVFDINFNQLKRQLIGNDGSNNEYTNSSYAFSCSNELSKNLIREIMLNYPPKIINDVVPKSWR